MQTQVVVKFLERIEDVLKKKGDNAFIGSLEGKASAADYLAWPWLERLEAVATFNASKFNVLLGPEMRSLSTDRKGLLKSVKDSIILWWKLYF